MKLKKWVRREPRMIINGILFFSSEDDNTDQPTQYFNSVAEQYNDAWDNIQYILELRKERLKSQYIGIGITPATLLDVRGTNIEEEVFI